MSSPTPEERARAAAAGIAGAGARLLAVCEELHHVCEALAHLEGEHRAALAQLGIHHCHRRPARDLAADVVMYSASELFPYVSGVTEASARQAAQALLHMPCAGLLMVDPVDAAHGATKRTFPL